MTMSLPWFSLRSTGALTLCQHWPYSPFFSNGRSPHTTAVLASEAVSGIVVSTGHPSMAMLSVYVQHQQIVPGSMMLPGLPNRLVKRVRAHRWSER